MFEMYMVTNNLISAARFAEFGPQDERSKEYAQHQLHEAVAAANQTPMPTPQVGSDLSKLESFYRAKSLCEKLLQAN